MTTQPVIPPLLDRMQHRIHIQMSDEAARTFPARLADATPPGADLTLVPWKLIHRAASDAIAAHADPRTASLCAPALDVCRRWSEGETVPLGEASAAYRGIGEYVSEDEIDKDPVGYGCGVVARCTDPHHAATWHTTDVALSTIASLAGEGAARARAFDAFGDLLLEYVRAA